MKARFTYFRNTGTYHSEGYGIVPDDFRMKQYSKSELFVLNNNHAPGLNVNNNGSEYIWLIQGGNTIRLIIGSE